MVSTGFAGMAGWWPIRRSGGRRPGQGGGLGGAVEEAQQFYRDGHHEGAVLLGGDLNDGLQEPELQGGRVGGHYGGGLCQLLGRLVLAVGRDDPRAALAFGFGLAGHRPFHRFRQGDVLDLDPLDPDAPWFLGGGVDDLLELGVDLVPFGQQRVQVTVADHRPQRRLGDLGYREGVVLHVDERLDWVDDPVVDDRIHPQGDVVPGDALLAGHGRRDDLHVDLAQPV